MVSKLPQLPEGNLCILTGATGALGQELLCQMLERQPDFHLVVVSRGNKEATAERRITSIVRRHFTGEDLEKKLSRLSVLDGDITLLRLGLSSEAWDDLASRTRQVMHCAAGVRFDQPLNDARRINLEGTSHVLDLARAARKAGNEGRFNYISTSYVAGKRRGVAYEDELEHKAGFHNTYEQTKYEAELLVRAAMNDLPASIMRPSIIVGDSRTGETINYKAFYWPLRAYANNQMRVMPANKHCRVDVVPVDYVASGAAYMCNLPQTVGNTYHLTAGRSNLVTVREVAKAALSYFNVKKPIVVDPRFVNLLSGPIGKYLLDERTYKTIKLGSPYYPYLGMRLEFDNSKTAVLLEDAGIVAPSVREFFNTLFRYCAETDWGKKPRHAQASRNRSENASTELPATPGPVVTIKAR